MLAFNQHPNLNNFIDNTRFINVIFTTVIDFSELYDLDPVADFLALAQRIDAYNSENGFFDQIIIERGIVNHTITLRNFVHFLEYLQANPAEVQNLNPHLIAPIAQNNGLIEGPAPVLNLHGEPNQNDNNAAAEEKECRSSGPRPRRD